MKKILLIVLLGAVVMPGALLAQSGPSCDLGQSRQLYSVAKGAVIYLGGAAFICDNGMTIRSDSGVYVQATGRIDFMGNVHFNESERTLTSQNAQYVGRERRLMAQGNVILTDKRDGSTLRAPALDYFQKGGSNPQDKIEIYSGRPHAVLIRDRANSASAKDTTTIDSDAMTLIGQQYFRGRGNVLMKRGTLNTKSGFAEFAQDSNYMHLRDHAVVESDTFKLSADTIDADLVNGDQFKAVRARRDAKLDSEQADIDAPRLIISFDSGLVSRMVAVGGERVGKNLPQANTVSDDFTLTADSIDALSPKQKLEKVIAIGTAYAARKPDSLDAKLPALIARDWVRGDTVQAFFAQAEHDTTRVLQRLVANGTPASSTYKFRQKVAKDSTQLSVNYLTAKHIDVTFRNGDVDQVRAEGDIRGLYLQPPKQEKGTARR